MSIFIYFISFKFYGLYISHHRFYIVHHCNDLLLRNVFHTFHIHLLGIHIYVQYHLYKYSFSYYILDSTLLYKIVIYFFENINPIINIIINTINIILIFLFFIPIFSNFFTYNISFIRYEFYYFALKISFDVIFRNNETFELAFCWIIVSLLFFINPVAIIFRIIFSSY